jgi:hypothetical protein
MYLRPAVPWPGAVAVEPDVGAVGASPVASAATKLVVMSALARRQRRAALPGVFELGISDMGSASFPEVVLQFDDRGSRFEALVPRVA